MYGTYPKVNKKQAKANNNEEWEINNYTAYTVIFFIKY